MGSDGSASEAVNGCRADCSVGGSEVSLEDIFTHLQGDAIEIVSGAPWTTSMPKLPQEIVDHIVDRVYGACNGYALETDTQ